MSNSSSTLLQIPNELLLDIFCEFDRATLLRLAAVCRHLYAFTHSILLRRQITHLHALVDRGDLVTHGKSIDYLLSGGKPALSPTVFNVKYKSTLSDDLHAFYALVLRLHPPIRVELRLSPGGGYIDLPGDAARRWPFELAAVMNAIAENPQSVLTVTRGRSWKSGGRPFKYTINNLPQSTPSHSVATNGSGVARSALSSDSIFQHLVRPVLRFLGIYRTGYKSPIDTAEIDTPTTVGTISQLLKPCLHTCPQCIYPALEAFHIHSSLLFHLPLFSWTLKMLNTAPIKRLSFSDVELTLHDWAYILACITIPTLEELSLQQSPVAIALPDLHDFLKRHPSITVLDLAKHVAIGDPATPPSENILPNLAKLSAHPEYLLHFLNSPLASPHLKHVIIAPERNTFDLDSYAQYFNYALHHLAQRTQDITLSLNFASDAALAKCLSPIQDHGLPSVQPEQQIKCVVNIEINANETFDAQRFDTVLHWLRQFPCLRDISFPQIFDPYYPKGDVWAMHPQLRTLQVSGDTYQCERATGEILVST